MREIGYNFPGNTPNELRTVNPLVGGSNPSRGANISSKTPHSFGLKKALFQVSS